MIGSRVRRLGETSPLTAVSCLGYWTFSCLIVRLVRSARFNDGSAEPVRLTKPSCALTAVRTDSVRFGSDRGWAGMDVSGSGFFSPCERTVGESDSNFFAVRFGDSDVLFGSAVLLSLTAYCSDVVAAGYRSDRTWTDSSSGTSSFSSLDRRSSACTTGRDRVDGGG